MDREQKFRILFVVLGCGVMVSLASTELKNSELQSAGAKQKVENLENEWVTAEAKHDTATLRRILDDKFVASFGAAKPFDKEGFIRGVVSGDIDPTESQTVTDRTVIVDENTAVVVGIDTLHGTKKGGGIHKGRPIISAVTGDGLR